MFVAYAPQLPPSTRAQAFAVSDVQRDVISSAQLPKTPTRSNADPAIAMAWHLQRQRSCHLNRLGSPRLLAFVGSVIAEIVAGNSGIGNVMLLASSNFNVPLVFAALVVVGVIGVGMYAIFDIFERPMTAWSVRGGDSGDSATRCGLQARDTDRGLGFAATFTSGDCLKYIAKALSRQDRA
jgi:hypothetical protein